MSEIANNSEKQKNSGHPQKDGVTEHPATNDSSITDNASAAGTPLKADDAVDPARKAAESTSPKVENKKTPAKRTPKRMSFIERAQKESEELVKNLGGSLELDGGRRTRSSTRGTPTRSSVVATPPPAKKSKASSASSGSSTPSRRGRGRKIDISSESADTESATEETKNDKTEEVSKTAEQADKKSEKTSVENAENSVVDDVKSVTNAEEKSSPKAEVATADVKSKDKTDAALKPVPEEEESNVDECIEKTKEKKSDSPMDVDADEKLVAESDEKVPPTTESVPDTPKDKTVSEIIKNTGSSEKQPTPEPMEVDPLSSKENDDVAKSSQAAAEDVEKETPEESEKSSTASKEDVAVVQDSSETHTQGESVVSKSATEEEIAVPLATPEKPCPEPVKENDVKSSVADEVDTLASDEPQATVKSTLVAAAENINKSENDMCEPKIVSPSKTDGAVAATPQYCN